MHQSHMKHKRQLKPNRICAKDIEHVRLATSNGIDVMQHIIV